MDYDNEENWMRLTGKLKLNHGHWMWIIEVIVVFSNVYKIRGNLPLNMNTFYPIVVPVTWVANGYIGRMRLSWVSRWWCVVKLTQNKRSMLSWMYCVLEWFVLRISAFHEISAVRLERQWSDRCSTSLPNDHLIIGLWCVAWIASGKTWVMSFSTFQKHTKSLAYQWERK